MITIKSKLNIDELNKICDEYSEDRLSLNLAYLQTHHIDGSRKTIEEQLKEEDIKESIENKNVIKKNT